MHEPGRAIASGTKMSEAIAVVGPAPPPWHCADGAELGMDLPASPAAAAARRLAWSRHGCVWRRALSACARLYGPILISSRAHKGFGQENVHPEERPHIASRGARGCRRNGAAPMTGVMTPIEQVALVCGRTEWAAVRCPKACEKNGL